MVNKMDFATALAQLKVDGLYRENQAYTPIDGAYVMADGQRCLMLASNNYLSMTHDASVKTAAIEAIEQYGTGSGGARLTTGSHPLYAELEHNLAVFKKTEAAVTFNTGYMANLGIISALMNHEDVIFSDALNHASIIDGCRLSGAQRKIFPHSDMDALAQLLAITPCQGKRLIVVDGVFSMDGDIAPLPQLVELARKFNALLMVDDAHATGILGNGHGTAAHFGLQGQVDIQMGTLSKSLGAEGAYVAGSRPLIEFLINKARSYIFSTALSPAVIGAANQALKLLIHSQEKVDRVLQNAAMLRETLQGEGIAVGGSITPILPILIGGAEETVQIAKLLRQEGIIVSAIRPPTVPTGASRLRLTVSANHRAADLMNAATMIAREIKKIKG